MGDYPAALGPDTSSSSQERAPPDDGALAIVFTDIKDSTALWEASSPAMQTALQLHDDIIRRTILAHGGYEVKAIGDAFMVAFASATAALGWCLVAQRELLDADWPKETLEHPSGREVCDKFGNVVFRGLSVRMGVHWGDPIRKPNAVTWRKDYIGPMVHRAARAIEVADGGQIVVTGEFLAEFRRGRETEGDARVEKVAAYAGERGKSRAPIECVGRVLLIMLSSSPTATPVKPSASSSEDLELTDLGDQELKGLSNPLHLYMVIPSALRGRLEHYPLRSSSLSSLWQWMHG